MAKYSPSLPDIPKRCYNYKESREELYPTNTLPFITLPKRPDAKTRLCFWHVPPVDDYSLACRIGREYAAHFIQYLKDNPDYAEENTLGSIAKNINFYDESAAKGYWVGFFSHMERFILRGAKRVSVFDDLDRLNAHYDVIEAEDSSELESRL